jgi:hypothetical protein
MAEIDPKDERQRLARVYSEVNEGELEQLAQHAWTLTQPAREALREQIAKRGLPFVLVESPTHPMYEALVTIRCFRDIPDALLAKSILESAEIECFLADDNIVWLDWFWSNAVGGVKLSVPEEDVVSSNELLDQAPLESFIVPGIGEYKQPRCPNCESFDVWYRELIKRMAYLSLFGTWLVGFIPPIPLRRHGWKCHSCGHGWEDPRDGDASMGDASPKSA